MRQVASISCLHDLFLFKITCNLNLLINFPAIRRKDVLFLYKITFNEMEAASMLPEGEIHAENHHKKEDKSQVKNFS